MKNFFQKLIRYKSFWFALLLAISVLVIWLKKEYILRGIAHSMVSETSLKDEYDAVFILGGNAVERAKKAEEIRKSCIIKQFYCTGLFVSHEFQMLQIPYTEAEFTKFCAVKFGIPDSEISVINNGTSTKEEAEIFLDLTIKNNFSHVLVITTQIHTGRASKIFKRIWGERHFDIIGAESLHYDLDHWWQSEDGMIAINNEMMKTLYYWWKY